MEFIASYFGTVVFVGTLLLAGVIGWFIYRYENSQPETAGQKSRALKSALREDEGLASRGRAALMSRTAVWWSEHENYQRARKRISMLLDLLPEGSDREHGLRMQLEVVDNSIATATSNLALSENDLRAYTMREVFNQLDRAYAKAVAAALAMLGNTRKPHSEDLRISAQRITTLLGDASAQNPGAWVATDHELGVLLEGLNANAKQLPCQSSNASGGG